MTILDAVREKKKVIKVKCICKKFNMSICPLSYASSAEWRREVIKYLSELAFLYAS